MTAVYDTPEGEVLREFEGLVGQWEGKVAADIFLTGPANPAVLTRREDAVALQDLVKRIWSRLNHLRKAEERAA